MTKKYSAEIKRLKVCISKGITHFKEAGRIVLELKKKDENIVMTLVNSNPLFNRGLLETCMRLARGEMLDELVPFLSHSPAAYALAKLPISEQRKAVKAGGLWILGESQPYLVPINKLSGMQVKQAIDPISRVIIAPEKQIRLQRSSKPAWEIVRGLLRVNHACDIPGKEVIRLAKILARKS